MHEARIKKELKVATALLIVGIIVLMGACAMMITGIVIKSFDLGAAGLLIFGLSLGIITFSRGVKKVALDLKWEDELKRTQKKNI